MSESFWNKIDKILYINLDFRKDRNQHLLSELEALGAPKEKIERFEAIKNNHGFIGCTLSHIRCIQIAKERNYENVMILEDDIVFRDKKYFIQQSSKIFDTSFDVFMLAVNLLKHEYMNNDFIRVLSGKTTTGYIVKKDYYDTLIANYKEGLHKLLTTGNRENFSIDGYLIDTLQPKDQWLTFTKLTVSQLESFSDIERRNVNYDCFLIKDLRK